jgi:hypothetical protein
VRLLNRKSEQALEVEVYDEPAAITGTVRFGGLLLSEVTIAVHAARDGRALLSFQGQHATVAEGGVLTIHLRQQIKPD